MHPVEYFVTEDWGNEAEDTISIQKQIKQSSCVSLFFQSCILKIKQFLLKIIVYCSA